MHPNFIATNGITGVFCIYLFCVYQAITAYLTDNIYNYHEAVILFSPYVYLSLPIKNTCWVNYPTTQLPNYPTTQLPNYPTTQLPNYPTTELQNYR
ncbi:MAG: hypothetical protein ACI8RO_001762, partial [Flavobacteriales bacterium]